VAMSARNIAVACLLLATLTLPSPSAAAPPLELKPGKPSAAHRTELPPPTDLEQPPADAQHFASGLITRVLRPGSGGRPATRNDLITVHYTVWTRGDGQTVDTTRTVGKPKTIRVGRGFEGFQEAVTTMVEGEKLRAWIPADLAYGDAPRMPQGDLVVDVELVAIRRGPEPPPDLAAPPTAASRSASGLTWLVLQPGSGDRSPGPADVVVARYEAWSTDGVLLDDAYFEDEPSIFTMDRAIPGLVEAFSTMVPGEKRRLWLPAELTSLADGSGYDRPVVFDVEMIAVSERPQTPPDVHAPPADAETTPLGVSYRILRPGKGQRRPDYGDTIEVEYAGWTVDGAMFDASYKHGRPGTFKVDDSMPLGWNDAMRAMVVGEKRRIWIPANLAYGDVEGRPKGMLVFDVELKAIH